LTFGSCEPGNRRMQILCQHRPSQVKTPLLNRLIAEHSGLDQGVAQGATPRTNQGTIRGAGPRATPWTIYRAALGTIPGIARRMADQVVLWVAQRVIQGATRGATPWVARGLAPG
jgi:hypothetical protein